MCNLSIDYSLSRARLHHGAGDHNGQTAQLCDSVALTAGTMTLVVHLSHSFLSPYIWDSTLAFISVILCTFFRPFSLHFNVSSPSSVHFFSHCPQKKNHTSPFSANSVLSCTTPHPVFWSINVTHQWQHNRWICSLFNIFTVYTGSDVIALPLQTGLVWFLIWWLHLQIKRQRSNKTIAARDPGLLFPPHFFIVFS